MIAEFLDSSKPRWILARFCGRIPVFAATDDRESQWIPIVWEIKTKGIKLL
jgi:hypothetical protein